MARVRGEEGSGGGDDAPVFAVLQSIGGSDDGGSHRALPTPRRRMKGFRATRIDAEGTFEGIGI